MRNFILLFFLTFLYGGVAVGQCPWDEVDCQGLCGMFIDEDEDSYCDYSILSSASGTETNTCSETNICEAHSTNPNDQETSISDENGRSSLFPILFITICLCCIAYGLSVLLVRMRKIRKKVYMLFWDISFSISLFVCLILLACRIFIPEETVESHSYLSFMLYELLYFFAAFLCLCPFHLFISRSRFAKLQEGSHTHRS